MRKGKVYKSTKKTATKEVSEKEVHRMICAYIRLKYPDVMFFSDMSGVNVGAKVGAEMKLLRSSRGIPDLFVAHPLGGYAGLFLEIKRDDARLFLKDGSLSKDKHVVEQAMILDKLKHLGYASYFAVGLLMATDIIDEYMQGEKFPVE